MESVRPRYTWSRCLFAGGAQCRIEAFARCGCGERKFTCTAAITDEVFMSFNRSDAMLEVEARLLQETLAELHKPCPTCGQARHPIDR